VADVLTPTQRRLNMSRIRSRDTKPELLLRRGLHGKGFRFRLQCRDLPGRPDLVLARYRAVIFAHGCFWHGHSCPMCRVPATRPEFWSAKIAANISRDQRAIAGLHDAGWRVLVVWECALRGPGRLAFDEVLEHCSGFLKGDRRYGEIFGISTLSS